MSLIGHKTALNPNKKQIELFKKSVGLRRACYNHMVANQMEFDRRNLIIPLKEFISNQGKDLTYKRNNPEIGTWEEGLKEISSSVQDRAVQDYKSAWSLFFDSLKKGRKISKPPTFCKRGSHESFRLKCVCVIEHNRIRLPIPYGWVKIYEKGYLPEGKYIGLQLCISRIGNRWYFSAAFEKNKEKTIPEFERCGIDVGIKTLATVYDGKQIIKYENPKPLIRYQRKLRKLNRELDRRTRKQTKIIDGKEVQIPLNWKEQSKRREKTKVKLAKIYAKIRFLRQYNHHKTTTEIIKKYNKIVIEDLNVAGLMQGRQAKHLGDAALSNYLSYLKYKAERNGNEIIEMGRFYPSSKTCHKCSNINKDLKREDIWICPNCNTKHQRDENAAKVAYDFKDAGMSTESINDKKASNRKTKISSIEQKNSVRN